MSYSPATLGALRVYLIERTGLRPVSLGIVGDAAHQRRASYHNGQDAVTRYGRHASTDYSIRTRRDREPYLTNAASAIDIGNFPRLRSMSAWLVTQARRNATGTSDIREIIYSPDGRRVLRWDRERGYASLPRTGEADDSHLWHTHISYYRDSERRSKLGLFRRYFEPASAGADWKVNTGGGTTRLYDAAGRVVGSTTGTTFYCAARIKGGGKWLYRIVSGRYAGKYLTPDGDMTFADLAG